MANARAFPMITYDPEVVTDPGKQLAPPYDVVTKAQRDTMITDHPYQSIRLELPENDDPAASATMLKEWLSEGVLAAGDLGVAVIQQRFIGPDGVRRTRTAVCCEVELSAFSEGEILPHERTFDIHIRARVELMRKTGANISPVLLTYHDPERSLSDLFASVTDDEPDFTATDPDGTQTAVWFVTDTALCEAFSRAVKPHPLLIADGHHRYTAALAYRDEKRGGEQRLVSAGGSEHNGPPHTSSSWHEGVLAMVMNSADPGIEVFPTHRIVRDTDPQRLDRFIVEAGAFKSEEYADISSAQTALDQLDVPGFIVTGGDKPLRLLSVPDELDMQLAAPDSCDAARKLDVLALHALVIDGGAVLADHCSSIDYTRSLEEAIEQANKNTLVFIMRGVDSEQIYEVARAGELLPQKSTYYYPKVPTGVAFRAVEPNLLGF